MISKGGINDCSYQDFEYVLKVGLVAPFYLAKCFKDSFNDFGAILNISSTRAYMSQSNTESYSASKGGINALTHALAVSLQGKVRVNAIAPGWIDTFPYKMEQMDLEQHLVKRVGSVDDIANMVLYLCSPKAGFITGQTFIIDGGMSKQLIYHNDEGWSLKR
jgi:NAD(P)-dependent dehydrogenase (short-subunit alcohol dehydrogenase family)